MKPRPLRSRQSVPGEETERISLKVSSVDKAALDHIADEKRVSLAWVVREAISRYLAGRENNRGATSSEG